MPWRRILFILLIVIIAAFMGANLDNKVPISVIFHTFPPVPVYLIMLYAFCAGVIVMLPMKFGRKNKDEKAPKKKPEKHAKEKEKTADINMYEDKP